MTTCLIALDNQDGDWNTSTQSALTNRTKELNMNLSPDTPTEHLKIFYYREMRDGFRPPTPNKYPLLVDTSVRESVIADWILVAENRYEMSNIFDVWAFLWRSGDRNPDDLFVLQRAVANEGLGIPSQIGEMIMEAAWSVIRADEALTAHAVAEYQQFPHWAARCKRSWEIQLTWAARALAYAAKLMQDGEINGEKVR